MLWHVEFMNICVSSRSPDLVARLTFIGLSEKLAASIFRVEDESSTSILREEEIFLRRFGGMCWLNCGGRNEILADISGESACHRHENNKSHIKWLSISQKEG
jgi:hypothetical protein